MTFWSLLIPTQPLFSSKAILYSFPFSVSLTWLFVFPSINGIAPILYTSSWMVPTFSLILSWPSYKTSGLLALGSGVCTCPLELPSWYPLLCPSVSSLILKFSILIHRLWASLDAPFNTKFPLLFDFPSADILYHPVHFSSYTRNVTAYLIGLIQDKFAWLYCIFNVKKMLP